MFDRGLLGGNLFQVLRSLDKALAAEARAAGCPHCGGRLDVSDFTRRPRLRSRDDDEPSEERRASFCCAVEGCRKRLTPFSVRFLGRKVYFAAVVLLVGALHHGPERLRPETLAYDFSKGFGLHVETVRRWCRWWREVAQGRFWRTVRRRLVGTNDGVFPWSVLAGVAGETTESRLVAALRFLAPLSSGSAVGGAAM